MDEFAKLLAEAERSKRHLLSVVCDVTSGTLPMPPGMSPSRALEILNGCVGDYSTIIKRLGGRNRG